MKSKETTGTYIVPETIVTDLHCEGMLCSSAGATIEKPGEDRDPFGFSFFPEKEFLM